MSTTKRKTLGATDGGKTEAERFRWEGASFEDAHAQALKWADHVRQRPSAIDRRKRNLLYASLYSNLPLLGFGVNSYTRSMMNQGQISLNVTQNAIDSLVSKTCKNRPRPMFTTVDGPYELREKAENADKYIDGMFYKLQYYQSIYPGKNLDTAIYGLGVSKCHEVDGEGVISRKYPWEMIWDDREALYGEPVHMGERMYYDRQEVFERWKRKDDKEWNDDLEEAVDARASETDIDDFDRDESSDQILVYEFYARPRGDLKGKKLVCIRGKTLKFDDYTDDHLPYNFQRPEVQVMGMWGIGICERVAGIQREINRIIRDIQRAMHLLAKPHWMVETSSNVNPTSLNNDIATIIKYTGAVPPTVYTPQSMSAEVFQHLQYLVRTLYEVTGISQLSAQSQKPAGLDSAVALRTYLNVETERFANFLRSAEESAAQDAYKLARVIGGLKKKPPAVAARSYTTGKVTPRVTWDKLDFDTITVQVYPTSKLPDTPAGRREYALELAQYTTVSQDDIYELLEWADTEAFAQEKLAGKKNVREDIAKMRRGEKVVRDPIGNHKMAFLMMLDAYESAKHDKLPVERLAVMRQYIATTFKYLTGKDWQMGAPNLLPGEQPTPEAQAAAPPPGAPVGPAPLGQPMPMLPPGAPPPEMLPLPNGGVPPQPV